MGIDLMKRRLKQPSDALILVASPLMVIGLICMQLGPQPWWVGVALFGASLVPLAGFFAVGYVRLRMSAGPWSLKALLHLGTAGLCFVMGALSLWLAASDLLVGGLTGAAVVVGHQMRWVGLAVGIVGALALLSHEANASP